VSALDPKAPTSTIAAIAPAVRGGKLRARDVAEAYLERISREDAALGCYVRVDAEGARS
jgi:Asp-tRNA(Asn)/Glu-tRNA(Gln) amidotransferase A subunit family amidase